MLLIYDILYYFIFNILLQFIAFYCILLHFIAFYCILLHFILFNVYFLNCKADKVVNTVVQLIQ